MSIVEITHEPLTYTPYARVSYFRDMLRNADQQDPDAAERLQRHAREMVAVAAERERRAWTIGAEQRFEYRVGPSRTDGQGGYGSPPLWLFEQAAVAPRTGRVLAGLMPSFPLPAAVSEVNIPRLTTGTLSGTMADNASVPTRDILDAAVTSPVVTIAGQSDMALQLLEQAPAGGYLDHVIYRDLQASYDYQLEQQLLTGTGASGQLLGVLNVPTGAGLAVTVAYTDASPTMQELWPFLGQAVAQLGDARLLPPEVWLMRTAREAWILFALDTQGMPVSTPGHNPVPPPPFMLDDDMVAPGSAFGGYPVFRDDAIPATRGVTANQDAIVLCRPSDMLLLESASRTVVDFESQSGTLGVRLQLRSYVAALVARYPTGIATITGTGMVVQSGY